MMAFKSVKRLMMLVAAGVLAVVGVPTTSHADQELGDMCWQLSPFIDTLRLSVIQADFTVDSPAWKLVGRWRANGSYQGEVTGALSQSTYTPGSLNLGIAGPFENFHSGDGQNDAVSLFAVLDGTLTGPWDLLVANDGFRNNGTLIPIDCSLEGKPNSGVGPSSKR
jgi:hypothetical protein